MMPIRPDNRNRYPEDWKQISARVRLEAGNMCEWCGVVNGRMIRRGTGREGRRLYRYSDDPALQDGRDARTGDYVPDTGEDTCDWRPAVKVVLTVAHLDHQPENCDRENLRALCQACHNAYDAPMRARGVAERRKAAAAIGDLLDDGECT